MSLRTDRVRLVILIKRNPGLTQEEFCQYWSGIHAAHRNELVLLQAAAVMWASGSQWHGMSMFKAKSYAKIFEIFQNEEYLKVVVPDKKLFLNREGCQVLPLDLFTIIDK
ncbi:hypothetical protein DFH07DRAFT_841648 [Mycena maculata]|uniref:EthD domain-containing protein n=1 Tax=Mycena maculata TaxID=230809 RepID=A0AAD7I9P6_9AGAR|nr:hypothetical protein DFH07DRAFT_841648 [Mycena maculata]